MSKVFVTRRELKSGDLPRVCLKCGDRTGKPTGRKLVFWPTNVRVMVALLGLIGYALASGSIVRIQSRLPLCDRHRGHFNRGNWIMAGGLAVGVVLMFGGLAAAGKSDAFPMVFMASLAVMLATLLVGAVVQMRAVRIEKVNGPDVQLNNVCDDFNGALETHREEADDDRDYDEDDEDDGPRTKKTARRNDDEDEDAAPRPRKRRRDDDD